MSNYVMMIIIEHLLLFSLILSIILAKLYSKAPSEIQLIIQNTQQAT